ncbi:hypothetical protein AFLA_010890 [Aspergillus flavus NRRL3357]|nr:hypothetical protein AFLA_010890 [Aspergillus flavus NRRL3357]
MDDRTRTPRVPSQPCGPSSALGSRAAAQLISRKTVSTCIVGCAPFYPPPDHPCIPLPHFADKIWQSISRQHRCTGPSNFSHGNCVPMCIRSTFNFLVEAIH